MGITYVSAELSNEDALEFQDRSPTPVVLGEANDAALFGTLTLESMGLVLDPFERMLRPARVRLGAVGPAGAVA